MKLGKKLPNSTINCRGLWGIFGEHNPAKPVAARQHKFHEKLGQLGNSIRNMNFVYRSSTSGTNGENVVRVSRSLGMGLMQRKGGVVERLGKSKRDMEVPNNVTAVTSLCWTKGINQLPFLTTP